MARIKTETPVKSIHGKLDKSDDVTFYYKKGDRQFAWKNAGVGPENTPTEAQLAVQDKFRNVSALAATDMADPEAKASWQEKADASNGKYTTARGAAFAYLWASYEEAGE